MPSSDASKYAPTAWGLAQFLELEFPSGQLALVKRPGVPQLVAAGILDSADALGALVNQKHIKRTKNGPPQIDGASMLKDTTNLMTVMQLVDKITAFMVVEPKVVEIWVEETDEDGQDQRVGPSATTSASPVWCTATPSTWRTACSCSSGPSGVPSTWPRFVSDSRRLWEAWKLSKAYHQPPSDIYGIEHPVTKFYFNRAVWLFGATLEGELEKAGQGHKKAKSAEAARMRVLSRWLGNEAAGFRQPIATKG
jgi:hypothetical protein